MGISGVISPLVWVISMVTLLITLLITTHEPPSMDLRGLNNWKRVVGSFMVYNTESQGRI